MAGYRSLTSNFAGTTVEYTRGQAPAPEVFEKFALLFERFEVFNGQRDPWQNLLTWEWVGAMTPERLEGWARKHDLKRRGGTCMGW